MSFHHYYRLSNMSQHKMDLTQTGKRLRELINKRGLTIRAVSQRTGIAYTTLQNVLSGAHFPRADVLMQLSVALEVSIDWLCFGSPEEGAAGVKGGAKGAAGAFVPGGNQPSMARESPGTWTLSPPGGQGASSAEDDLAKELQELRMIARLGSQAGIRKVLVALREAEGPLSRAELVSRLGCGVERLTADLAYLRRAGAISENYAGVVALKTELKATNSAEFAQLALESIEVLVRRILPAAERSDGTGHLLLVEGRVEHGRLQAVVEQIRDLIRGLVTADEDGSERITIVLAVQKQEV